MYNPETIPPELYRTSNNDIGRIKSMRTMAEVVRRVCVTRLFFSRPPPRYSLLVTGHKDGFISVHKCHHTPTDFDLTHTDETEDGVLETTEYVQLLKRTRAEVRADDVRRTSSLRGTTRTGGRWSTCDHARDHTSVTIRV